MSEFGHQVYHHCVTTSLHIDTVVHNQTDILLHFRCSRSALELELTGIVTGLVGFGRSIADCCRTRSSSARVTITCCSHLLSINQSMSVLACRWINTVMDGAVSWCAAVGVSCCCTCTAACLVALSAQQAGGQAEVSGQALKATARH